MPAGLEKSWTHFAVPGKARGSCLSEPSIDLTCFMREMVSEVTVTAARRAEHARRFPRCLGYFGAARNEAGGPGSFKFFPVSVTCVPSIFRTEMLLSKVIADICVGAVGRKGDALGKPAELPHLGSDPGDLLAVHLEPHGGAGLVVVEGLLVGIRAAQQDRQRKVAFRTNGEALRRVTYDDVIDHAWRSLFEIDHAHSVHASVGAAPRTVVSDQRDSARLV